MFIDIFMNTFNIFKQEIILYKGPRMKYLTQTQTRILNHSSTFKRGFGKNTKHIIFILHAETISLVCVCDETIALVEQNNITPIPIYLDYLSQIRR